MARGLVRGKMLFFQAYRIRLVMKENVERLCVETVIPCDLIYF